MAPSKRLSVPFWNNGRRNKEAGFVLIVTYFFIATLLTSLAGFFIRSINDLHLAQRRLERVQALYTAESGVEQAIEWMKTFPGVPTDNSYNITPPTAQTGETYVSIVATKDSNDSSIYWIRSKATYKYLPNSAGVTRTVQASVRKKSLAAYAYTQDAIDPGAYWVSGNKVIGKFHTNDVIQIYGAPEFKYRVNSTASAIFNFRGGYSADGMTGGSGYNPAWFNDSGGSSLPNLNQPRMIFSNSDRAIIAQPIFVRWIRFYSDDTYCTSNDINVAPSCAVPPPLGVITTFFSFLSPTAPNQPALVIDGTLARSIHVQSWSSIGIGGNILYNDCDYWDSHILTHQTTPKLSVVTLGSIIIMDSAWPSSDYLYMSGAYAALGGGLEAQPHAGGGVKNVLVFGSLLEQTPKKKGVIDPATGQVTSGYKGFYREDTRLAAQPPAKFPYGVQILSWEACDNACQ